MGLKEYILRLLPKNLRKEIEDSKRIRQNLKKYDPDQYLNPKFESSIAALDYYKCIFVHIPKNAGLSVSYTLFGNTGGSHRKIKDYQELFSEKTYNRYYKFTFVRNPWDRLVSTYFFLKKGGITPKDKEWAENNLGMYPDFKTFVMDWVTEKNVSNSLHFQHQHKFLENNEGQLEINFIGRFENLQEDFVTITKELGIKRNLKKTNTSQRKQDYRAYYDADSKAIVASVYKKDIQLFNYEY